MEDSYRGSIVSIGCVPRRSRRLQVAIGVNKASKTAERRRERTGSGRVGDGVALEAERLLGAGDSDDGDSTAAIHCQSQVKVRSKSGQALFASFVYSLFARYLLFVCSLFCPWRISRCHPSRCPYGS